MIMVLVAKTMTWTLALILLAMAYAAMTAAVPGLFAAIVVAAVWLAATFALFVWLFIAAGSAL
jgi:hypothetical protein